MPNEDKQNGAAEITRALELELKLRRADWQRTHARSRAIRQLSLVLVAVIIVGAVVALFVIFNRLNQARENRLNAPAPPEATP